MIARRLKQVLTRPSVVLEPVRYRRLAADDPERAALVAQVCRERLTYLTPLALTELAKAADEVEAQGHEGIFIETGAALGGSAIVLTHRKRADRPFLLYDTFGLIPPPTDEDGADVHARYATIAAGEARGIKGDTYYGYRENLLDEVKQSFARFGVPVDENSVQLVQGLFEDTLQVDQPVALAHIDCDWYQSVKVCLERIAPHVVIGGRLVIDDYFAWSGCRKAVDEFFAGRTGWRFERKSRLHIIRGA